MTSEPVPASPVGDLPISFADVTQAADRLREVAHRTPVLTSRALDEATGATVLLKAENLQRVGAFKFRGACNAVFKLDEAAAQKGVVTHSSGNHAQALALAARLRGIAATIVMPSNSPKVKVDAVRGYGATIVFCEPTQQAREAAAAKAVVETGGTLIPPYDHADVIAGHGNQRNPALQSCNGQALAGVASGMSEAGQTVAAEAQSLDASLGQLQRVVRTMSDKDDEVVRILRSSTAVSQALLAQQGSLDASITGLDRLLGTLTEFTSKEKDKTVKVVNLLSTTGKQLAAHADGWSRIVNTTPNYAYGWYNVIHHDGDHWFMMQQIAGIMFLPYPKQLNEGGGPGGDATPAGHCRRRRPASSSWGPHCGARRHTPSSGGSAAGHPPSAG